MTRSRTFRTTAVAVGLGVAGMGIGLDSAAAAPSRPSAAAVRTQATGDIVATAQAAGSFSTLLAAAEAAGLVDALKAPGPYTVFAPTDAAFAELLGRLAKLGITTEALLANKALLTEILTYHVVSGAVPSSAITGPLGPKTLEGRQLLIIPQNGKVTINGEATVVTADVAATNGVIHVIDRVLLPPKKLGDIVAVATEAGSFTTLLAAAKAAGLVEALQGPGPYTVFAPTDAAFNTLMRRLRTTPAKLLSNPTQLANILKYHVVSGRVASTDLGRRTVAPTLQGRSIVVRKSRAGVTVNTTARVVKADIPASNGVIHVINRVLIPRS